MWDTLAASDTICIDSKEDNRKYEDNNVMDEDEENEE
jgi:hypothetical protein